MRANFRRRRRRRRGSARPASRSANWRRNSFGRSAQRPRAARATSWPALVWPRDRLASGRAEVRRPRRAVKWVNASAVGAPNSRLAPGVGVASCELRVGERAARMRLLARRAGGVEVFSLGPAREVSAGRLACAFCNSLSLAKRETGASGNSCARRVRFSGRPPRELAGQRERARQSVSGKFLQAETERASERASAEKRPDKQTNVCRPGPASAAAAQ